MYNLRWIYRPDHKTFCRFCRFLVVYRKSLNGEVLWYRPRSSAKNLWRHNRYFSKKEGLNCVPTISNFEIQRESCERSGAYYLYDFFDPIPFSSQDIRSAILSQCKLIWTYDLNSNKHMNVSRSTRRMVDLQDHLQQIYNLKYITKSILVDLPVM